MLFWKTLVDFVENEKNGLKEYKTITIKGNALKN